jgi:heme oxygenase
LAAVAFSTLLRTASREHHRGFRHEYRALLDALPVDARERQRVVDECRAAFAAHSRFFAELAREFPAGDLTGSSPSVPS